MASLDNFIKRSWSFMETGPRIVQRHVGFIAVLSQFCDSYDEFALSLPVCTELTPERERMVRGAFTRGVCIPLFLLP
jgi:hypothetical protein